MQVMNTCHMQCTRGEWSKAMRSGRLLRRASSCKNGRKWTEMKVKQEEGGGTGGGWIDG